MTKKQIKTKAEEAIDYLDSVSRDYQGRVFCVNVKRYNDNFDVEVLASSYPRQIKEAIIEEFTEEKLYNAYSYWLGCEADYFVGDYLRLNCQDKDEVKKHMAYLQDDIG